MKTDKQWLASFPVRFAHNGKAFYSLTESDIKAIQDEAFKAGMLKAIKLCHANEMSNLYIWQRIQREYDKLP